MAKSSSAELTERGSAQLAVIADAILGRGELPPAADPEAMSQAIMERILGASSFEEAFTQQDLTPWRSLLEVPVYVRDVHFNRSGYEGQAVYAVCDLELADGSESKVTVSCGGKNVLAQLVAMLKNGWQGNPVRLIANRTGEGFDALWLEAVEL